MVQIIPEGRGNRSFLESILGGAAAAAGSVGELMPQYMQMRQQQEQAQNRTNAMRSYGKKLNIPNFEHLDPNIQKLIVGESFKQPKQPAPFTVKDVSGLFQNIGYDKDALGQIGLDEWESIVNRANSLMPHVGREGALLQAIREFQSPRGSEGQGQGDNPFQGSQQGQQQPSFLDLLGFGNYYRNRNGQQRGEAETQQEEGEGFFSPFKKGLQGSISGRIPSILGGQSAEQYEQSTALPEGASFVDRLLHGAGQVTGDLPYYGAGGTVGSQLGAAMGAPAGPFGAGAGAVVGGGAGAVALRNALNQGLTEYHKWQSKGFDGSFEDFIHSASQVAKEGVGGAAEGAIFSILGEALPALKAASPSLKKLIEKSRAPQSALTGAIQATGLLGAKSAAKGELPSSEEIADTFAQLIGLNLAHKLPGSLRKVENAMRMTGARPEMIAGEVAKEMQSRGVEPTNVREVERIISDITSSYAGPEREAALGVVDTLKNLKTPEPRKMAETLAGRPIDEALEYDRKAEERRSRPPTEKELAKRQHAKEGADQLDRKMDSVREDMVALERVLNDPKNRDRKLYESALRSKEAELNDLQRKHRSLMSIAEKGIEPFSKEGLKEPIEKHMTELEDVARNPEGETAAEWQKMFARDQKHVDDFAKLLQKERLPEAPYRDRYVKTLEAYQEAYSGMLKQLESTIQEKTSSVEGLSKRTKAYKNAHQEMGYLKNMLDLLKKNDEINRAKTGKQIDKIAQLYQLKKPGSALTRQILKGLRGDIPELQKEFITNKKKQDALEKRTTTLFDQQVKAIDKMLAEYRKNPSETLLKNIANEAGVDAADLKQVRSEGRKVAEEMIKDAQNGVPEKEVEESIIKKMLKLYPKNKFGQAVFWALLSTEAQNVIKFLTGLRVPVSTLTTTVRTLLPKTASGRTEAGFYTYGLASVYNQLKDSGMEIYNRYEYRKLKTGREKADFVMKLKRDGYSSSEIKAVVKH